MRRENFISFSTFGDLKIGDAGVVVVRVGSGSMEIVGTGSSLLVTLVCDRGRYFVSEELDAVDVV